MNAHPSHTSPPSSHTLARSTVGIMRRVNVALYVRVSTDKQAEFGMSLDAQTAELERYCSERGWDVAETFVDAGFSGKDTDRPAFKRMIARIKEGGVDAIAVTKLDRLRGPKSSAPPVEGQHIAGHHSQVFRGGPNPLQSQL